jgi:hypothetical protein
VHDKVITVMPQIHQLCYRNYATKSHQLLHADQGYIHEILTGLTLNLKIHQEY